MANEEQVAFLKKAKWVPEDVWWDTRQSEWNEKQEPKRIGKRLQRLIATGTAVANLAGGAATFSGNVNDFTANVLELGEKIGLTRDSIQSNP